MRFARVFGGNDDEVSGCLNCSTLEDIQTGKAVTRSAND